ncbi:MAG: hypothetical protein ACXWOH_10755 [Bdellovibrionota bacterium]
MKADLVRKRTYALVAVAAGITLMVSACGPGAPAPTVATPGVKGIPANASANLPAGTTNATINSIVGTYSGKLNRKMPDGTVARQDFSYVLTQTDPNPNQNGAKFSGTFSSTGAAGNFNFTSPLGIDANAVPSGGDDIYGFRSYSQASPAIPADLSESYVALQLDVALNSSTQFDPAQSRIYFLDCGFSQGADCEYNASDVFFDSVLGKR